MAFGRQTQEQIYSDMERWAKGVNPSVTDYRVGAKYRTVLEAVAFVAEKFYDRVYKGLKDTIANGIYSALGFSKLPATYSTGTVTFSSTTAPAQGILIGMGTIVQVPATSTKPAIQFQTTMDAYLQAGTTSVGVPVICLTAGITGNIDAHTITQAVTIVSGISTVSNAAAYTNAQDAETPSQQRYRFSQFVKSRARGTLLSMQYAATTVNVIDPVTGNITEQVRQAVATEGAGTVAVYVWNGVGAASSTLLANVTKTETGYIDPTLGYVYGYKPAGIIMTVATMPQTAQNVTMHVVPKAGYSFNQTPIPANTTDITQAVNKAISGFFSGLIAGQTLVWSQLLAAVQNIAGVQEVGISIPAADVVPANTYTIITLGAVTFN